MISDSFEKFHKRRNRPDIICNAQSRVCLLSYKCDVMKQLDHKNDLAFLNASRDVLNNRVRKMLYH